MARTRRQFKQHLSLNDRLKTFSDQLKSEADKLRPGPQRDEILKRARRADTAAQVKKWAASSGLQPPK